MRAYAHKRSRKEKYLPRTNVCIATKNNSCVCLKSNNSHLLLLRSCRPKAPKSILSTKTNKYPHTHTHKKQRLSHTHTQQNKNNQRFAGKTRTFKIRFSVVLRTPTKQHGRIHPTRTKNRRVLVDGDDWNRAPSSSKHKQHVERTSVTMLKLKTGVYTCSSLAACCLLWKSRTTTHSRPRAHYTLVCVCVCFHAFQQVHCSRWLENAGIEVVGDGDG